MKVLVACEFSGIVREAFRRRGHFAVSCDYFTTEQPGPHLVCDVLSVLGYGWDLMIAHPPCTYLTNSGVCRLYGPPKNSSPGKVYGEERFLELEKSAEFFTNLLNAPIPRIAIENPLPHHFAKDLIGQWQQTIHPWWFGHAESKRTCLWLKNLPPLMATMIESGELAQSGHKLPPSENRWKERSRTFTGVAEAMATQWG